MGKVSRAQKKLEKLAYKADKNQAKEEREALTIENSTKTGVHNCPSKDAGTTHPFRARCLRQKHGGYCPACGAIYSYMHGCREHGIKKDDLLEECPSEEDKLQFRLEHGIEAMNLEGTEEDTAVLEATPAQGKKKAGGRKRSSTSSRR